MYDNAQLYSQMFPWLFPYRLGGIGQFSHSRIMSKSMHKKWLLMYYDKRFQTDFYFSMIVFSREQIKSNITGSFLLAKKNKFSSIFERIVTLDLNVLQDISSWLEKSESFKPQTEEEKKYFAVMEDLDHIDGHTQDSLTCKKHMRNEIWSLISFKGSSSWFITLFPANSWHPICLYYAGTNKKFEPFIILSQQRDAFVLKNTVTAARFFHHMVQMFLKHVLSVGSNNLELYGKTSAYYGTIEQQGKLTLYLQAMI
jgi:hypothetical protein